MSDLKVPKMSKYQFLPPFKNDVEFEYFIATYFNELEETNSYDLFGRKGQKQHGLDVFSTEKWTVIQCKCKDITRPDDTIRGELLKELDRDFDDFKKFNKENDSKFSRFLFTSTFKEDAIIDKECINRSTESVTVKYWSWNALLRQVQNNTLTMYYGDIIDSTSEFFQKRLKVEKVKEDEIVEQVSFRKESQNEKNQIEHSKPIIDQLSGYINNNFKEINYHPIHLLVKKHPFRIKLSYSSTFSINTDNDELFQFFDSLQIEKDGQIKFKEKKFIQGVDDYENKTKKILKKLSNNLIFWIVKENLQINIRYSEHEKCNCARCRFLRFEFAEVFPELAKEPEDLDERFKLAYVHYQIGNFVEASEMFGSLSRETKSKNQVWHFIAQYNLSKLIIFIRNNYWGDNDQQKLIEEFNKIDLDGQFCSSLKSDVKPLLKGINDQSFYTNAKDKIEDLVSKIREHYQSQLKGGWSSANYTLDLVYEYAKIDSFLNLNYLVYDQFNEFSNLTQTFIEGLIASHAMNNSQPGRLKFFDDYIIKIIILYGKPDKVKKSFYQYKIDNLEYKSSSELEGQSFFERFDTLLQGEKKLREVYSNTSFTKNHFFWRRYNTIFSNMIVLMGLINLSKSKCREIAKKLLEFLRSEESLYPMSLPHIEFLISRKGKFLPKSWLKNFLIYVLESSKANKENLTETVCTQILKFHDRLRLDTKEKDILKNNLDEIQSDPTKERNSNSLVHLYRVISNSDIRKKLKDQIREILINRFDFDLFYMAAMYEIMDVDGSLFEQMKQKAIPSAKFVSARKVFTGEDDNRFPYLGMLINLCFKYNLDTTSSGFDVYRNIDPYYDWLLDMEGFDYNQFEPKWIIEYPTKYYFEKIQKVLSIKEKVREYLKNNRNGDLERRYFELFG